MNIPRTLKVRLNRFHLFQYIQAIFKSTKPDKFQRRINCNISEFYVSCKRAWSDWRHWWWNSYFIERWAIFKRTILNFFHNFFECSASSEGRRWNLIQFGQYFDFAQRCAHLRKRFLQNQQQMKESKYLAMKCTYKTTSFQSTLQNLELLESIKFFMFNWLRNENLSKWWASRAFFEGTWCNFCNWRWNFNQDQLGAVFKSTRSNRVDSGSKTWVSDEQH